MNTLTKEEIEMHAPPKEVLIKMVVEFQQDAARLTAQVEELKLKILLLEKSWNLPAKTQRGE